MAGAVQYIVKYIKTRIPKKVLELGFCKRDMVADLYTSLDDKIIKNVINDILKVDLNLNGGVYITIPLSRCLIDRVRGTNNYVVTVPKALTEGRSIISPLNLSVVSVLTTGNFFWSSSNSPESVRLADKMFKGVSSTPYLTTARLQLIGDNVIACFEPSYFLPQTILRCEIENNENLDNVRPQFYKFLGEIGLECCKMFLYNNNIIELNLGYISGGYEISSVKEEIENYKESFEKYDELLKKWRKLSVMNDRERLAKLITYSVGGNM